ncbi:MAG: MopE-related protein [Myxococcota bacterium]|nr:MopE-related protein [Myxococcota bacterium]
MQRLLWLTLALPVGCGDKETENNSSDADGDGYAIGEDCNDTDASIYPGAPETWYDGTDTDCLGDDDYDADADGERDPVGGGVDCNDTDASIYPGAPETWYDGVDSDCAEDNDFDADADGFEADTEGGDDCSDEDADIYPGAPETWYDGIDTDCAEDNDFDADADGFEADGYGGQDCDDSSDITWPDADEVIDGADNDCDGTDDDFRVDESYGALSVQGTDSGGGVGAALAIGDIDGDGLPDAAILQTSDLYYSDSGGGAVHLLLNADLQSSTSVTSATYQIVADTASGGLDGVWFISDVNNDSITELLVASTDSRQGQNVIGRAGLFASSELSSTVPELSEAERVLEGSGGTFGAAAASWPDMDGDGLDELVITAPNMGGSGAVYLWWSDDLSSTGTMTADDAVAISGAANGDELGADVVGMADLNGDGYGELVIGAPGAGSESGSVYLLQGNSSQISGQITGRAWMTVTGDAEGDRTGDTLAIGDVDGDGEDDLIIAATSEDTRAGRIHVVLGADFSAGTSSLSSIDHVSYGGASISGYAGTALASGGDMNDDGMEDILIGGPGASNNNTDAGEAWAVISGESGDRALVNAASSFYGSADEQVGSAVGMADIDGDGMDDILIGVPGESSLLSGEGAVYIGISAY